MDNLSTTTTEELLQMYSNADKTAAACGGHNKGNMNSAYRREYAEELGERGIVVPRTLSEKWDEDFKSNTDIPKGIFNGKGSY